MAKKKNAVKSALNSLRQALTVIKTAIVRFSADHVLAIGYNPTTKETIVTDIPQNLSSSFVLGEGGGSAELHPKVTLNITPHNTGAVVLNGVICLTEDAPEIGVLEDGCLISVTNEISNYLVTVQENETGTGTIILPVVKEDDNTSSEVNINNLLRSTGVGMIIDSATASNPVNCSFDTGTILITDCTKDASIDLDIVFEEGLG